MIGRTIAGAAMLALCACSSPETRTIYVYLEAGVETHDSGPVLSPNDSGGVTGVNDSSFDAPDAFDAGTGAFWDPCDPLQSLPCRPQFTCWPTHTPGASQEAYKRCTFYCNGPTDPNCGLALGGLCQSPVPGSGSLVCVPAH